MGLMGIWARFRVQIKMPMGILGIWAGYRYLLQWKLNSHRHLCILCKLRPNDHGNRGPLSIIQTSKMFKSSWAVWAFGQNSEYKLKCPWALWAFGQNFAVANNGNQNAHGHFGHMGRISKQKINAHGHYGRLGRVPLFWGKCPQ